MKVDLGIWDRLSRLIILLLIVAAVLGVALWYLPVIQKNEKFRRDILNWDSRIEKELERNRRLNAELEAYRAAGCSHALLALNSNDVPRLETWRTAIAGRVLPAGG